MSFSYIKQAKSTEEKVGTAASIKTTKELVPILHLAFPSQTWRNKNCETKDFYSREKWDLATWAPFNLVPLCYIKFSVC
jgi:hypothetical protein